MTSSSHRSVDARLTVLLNFSPDVELDFNSAHMMCINSSYEYFYQTSKSSLTRFSNTNIKMLLYILVFI